MRNEPDPTEPQALKNILSEVDLILSTTIPLPENRTARCQELLAAAMALADDLAKQQGASAAVLGHKGGSATARRHGSKHYRQMAAMRKTHGGGRPRKKVTTS